MTRSVLDSLRNRRFLGMTPGDWALYFLLCLTQGIPYFFDAFSHILPETVAINPWFLRVVFFIGLLAIGYVYRHQIKSNRAVIEAELAALRDRMARLALQHILELALKNLVPDGGPENYRANIMLIENGRLLIRFHPKTHGAPDLGIKLEKNQGCAGQAWGSHEQRAADLGRIQKTGDPKWNLTPDQQALTNHLGSILSTPIFDQKDKQTVIGVFNIDSEMPLKETCLLDSAISDMATDYASVFGVWLRDVRPSQEE